MVPVTWVCGPQGLRGRSDVAAWAAGADGLAAAAADGLGRNGRDRGMGSGGCMPPREQPEAAQLQAVIDGDYCRSFTTRTTPGTTRDIRSGTLGKDRTVGSRQHRRRFCDEPGLSRRATVTAAATSGHFDGSLFARLGCWHSRPRIRARAVDSAPFHDQSTGPHRGRLTARRSVSNGYAVPARRGLSGSAA